MNNLELVNVLEVAVFGLAIAQMLMILLTIRRERDVKDLRELVEDQRLRLAELKAWLAGRSASQSRRIASESKPGAEWTANVRVSESGMPLQETKQPRTPEDDAAAMKALEWQRDVAARLQSGLKPQMPPTEQAPKPASAGGFKWFKDEPNEREIAARGIVAGLGNTNQPVARDHNSLESKTIGSNTELDDVERTFRVRK